MIHVGQRVKFAQPVDAAEAASRFVVLEVNPPRPEIGDTAPARCLVRAISALAIAPTYVFNCSELVPA